MGSALSSADLYSSLPGSASQSGASDASSMASAVKTAVEEAMAAFRGTVEPSGDSKELARLTTKKGNCAFCGRAWCGLVKPGENPCRESKRALELSRMERDKAKGGETGEAA